MIAGPVVLLVPVGALLLTRGSRSLAGTSATALLVWLNLWWVLPLLDVRQELPALLLVPSSTTVLVVGHLVAIALLLAAFGLFSPNPGSATDLAVRSARRGDYLAAGEFWLEAGRPNRAYRSFLRARNWARAADVARSAGRLRHAAALLQKEGGGSLGSAAQIYARLGDEGQAQQLWSRYGQYLVESRQPELAIEPFLRAGDPRRAAHAVELALATQRFVPALVEPALRAARDTKRPQLGGSVALAAGRFREAGDLFLAAGSPLDAARAFERAGESLRAAEALRQAGYTDEAARLRAQRLAGSGQLAEAAREYQRAGLLPEAAAVLVQVGEHDEAFRLYQQAGLLREAAELARDHRDPREAARLFSEIEDWGEAGAAWERAAEPLEAARCYQRIGDYERALALLTDANLTGERAQLLALLGRVEDGFLTLFEKGDLQGAWSLLSAYGGTFPGLAEQLVKVGSWMQSRGDLTGAITAVQRAISGLPVSREILDALYFQAQLLEEHNDLRSAEAALRKIVDFDYGYRDAAQRLQLVSARRAAEDSQGSGVIRPLASDTLSGAAGDPSSRYVLGQELGRGGMGVVYRAFDQRLGRTVAIKVLNPRQHTPEALRRFEREARAAAALSHPGIVHIYDFDRGFESFYISMEFVSGPTLNQLIREEHAFVRHNLLPLMRQIVDAVTYAHANHVVHRDLKPANMILAERRQIKILDFGIARRLDELDLSASGATGTPYYMAPEQILGEEPDERTDVYALGVTFFQAATGKLPFVTGNVLRAHLEQPPPDPQALAPDLEPSISHVILRCLAKERAQRPRDGGALLAALNALSEGSPR